MRQIRTGGVRYAPSPTGRLHLGNLRTAWISGLWARFLKLPWIVRFEDIDAPRLVPGAIGLQLDDLKRLGLEPDRVDLQSDHHLRHWSVFREAIKKGQVYPCDCSRTAVRSALQSFASAPHHGAPVYSGHCRHRAGEPSLNADSWAWRFRMEEPSGSLDFIIARTRPGEPLDQADSLFQPGYHWACAIDDYDGQFDLLVRCVDLAPILPLQRAIQKWLGAQGFASVFHPALVVQNDGHRLEKRTRSVSLPELDQLGLSMKDVVDCFAKSFDHRQLVPLVRGEIRDESPSQIRLQELGLPVNKTV